MMETLVEAERALTHGLIDKAERLYRQVRENDPKSSIAVMGLARVALERGDDATAYLHAKAALAIDADNPAARHLVMRLAEVMDGRGESPPEPVDEEPLDHLVPPAKEASVAPASSPAPPASPPAPAPPPSPPSRRSFADRLLRRRLKRPK